MAKQAYTADLLQSAITESSEALYLLGQYTPNIHDKIFLLNKIKSAQEKLDTAFNFLNNHLISEGDKIVN